MRIRQWIAVACGVALGAGAAVAVAQVGGAVAPTDQGLIKVKSNQLDDVYVLPGADFRGYRKVMLDPTQVAFNENWLRNLNSPSQRIAVLQGTTPEEARRIAEEMGAGFGNTLANAFQSAGYEIVAAPGADVLRLSPRIVDLHINAPKTVTQALPSRVYTFDAGRATLELEARDSTTNALQARISDRRTAGVQRGPRAPNLTTTVTNRFDFGNLFDAWAQSCLKTVEQMKAQSPVVATIQAQRQ